MAERIIIDLQGWTLIQDTTAGALPLSWFSKAPRAEGRTDGRIYEAGFKDELAARMWARAKGILK